MEWGGDLNNIRKIHICGKKNQYKVCANCQYPEQASTTSLQAHIETLKKIYFVGDK